MHEEDKEWVTEQIRLCRPEHRAEAWSGYQQVYAATMNSEPVEHKRENKARHEANCRLRAFVEKSRSF